MLSDYRTFSDLLRGSKTGKGEYTPARFIAEFSNFSDDEPSGSIVGKDESSSSSDSSSDLVALEPSGEPSGEPSAMGGDDSSDDIVFGNDESDSAREDESSDDIMFEVIAEGGEYDNIPVDAFDDLNRFLRRS